MPAKTVIKHASEKMEKTQHALEEKLKTLRTGRATASQFEQVMIDYYGTQTPIKQVGNISIPEARQVVIQPWDASVLPAIEKVIISELSLNPQNDGKLIRITIPPLTNETRQQSVKQAKQIAEEAKVALRNIRRDANDKLKKLEHDKEISEDDLNAYEVDVQELTDERTKHIQEALEAKEKEINEE